MSKNSKNVIGSFDPVSNKQYFDNSILCHGDTLRKLVLSDELNSPKIASIGDAVDLSNVLDRAIFLNDDVDDEIANGIDIMIRFWNRIDKELHLSREDRQPIKLYINSYGGSMTAAYLIIDSIKLSETPVETINIGVAYSAAFEIFIAGHCRYAYPHSSFLFHEGSVGMNGDANKFRNYADFYNRLLELSRKHILSSTEITAEDYEQHQKDDWWFTADEALKYGICDEIAKELL